LYFVHSAYRLHVDDLVNTFHLRRPGFWSGIWRLKVPPKVKNLVWRMCKDCLPTRARHQDKGVECSTNCVSCNSNHEDLTHIAFDFLFVVHVWRMPMLWNEVNHAVLITNSAIDAIFLLLQNSVYDIYSLESLEALKP